MGKVEVRNEGAVRLVTINRPDVHNCIDGETAVMLAEAIEAFRAADSSRVMVVTGAGSKAFCSGADLKHVWSLAQHSFVDRAGPMGFARLDPGKPTIAAVNGYCFAGGLELAAWCDFRIAAANAEFGALNRRWGVPFTDGGTVRFARIVGQGNALWLIETGVRIDAARALAIGLVQEVVSEGKALDRALELASRLASYPQASLRADRSVTLAAWNQSIAEGLRLEVETCLPTAYEPEMRVGLARFAAKDREEPPTPR